MPAAGLAAGGAAGGKKAKIFGVVSEDKRTQSGLEVQLQLVGADGKPGLGTTKTDKTDNAGRYSFKDLTRGDYLVTCSKSATRSVARSPSVHIDADTTEKQVDLSSQIDGRVRGSRPAIGPAWRTSGIDVAGGAGPAVGRPPAWPDRATAADAEALDHIGDEADSGRMVWSRYQPSSSVVMSRSPSRSAVGWSRKTLAAAGGSTRPGRPCRRAGSRSAGRASGPAPRPRRRPAGPRGDTRSDLVAAAFDLVLDPPDEHVIPQLVGLAGVDDDDPVQGAHAGQAVIVWRTAGASSGRPGRPSGTNGKSGNRGAEQPSRTSVCTAITRATVSWGHCGRAGLYELAKRGFHGLFPGHLASVGGCRCSALPDGRPRCRPPARNAARSRASACGELERKSASCSRRSPGRRRGTRPRGRARVYSTSTSGERPSIDPPRGRPAMA